LADFARIFRKKSSGEEECGMGRWKIPGKRGKNHQEDPLPGGKDVDFHGGGQRTAVLNEGVVGKGPGLFGGEALRGEGGQLLAGKEAQKGRGSVGDGHGNLQGGSG
jgi:hypothetical protein